MVCFFFLMFEEGLEQKGQPPSPTKSKAEQPEDLQDDAEGRWSDSFSELLINFLFGGERFTLNSWERTGKLSFKNVVCTHLQSSFWSRS